MEEEWILKLVDQASGNAGRMTAGFGALDSAQLKAAQSAMGMAAATAKLASAEAAGNIAARDAAQAAVRRLQLQEALANSKKREADAAAADKARAAVAKSAAAEQAANLARMQKEQDAAAKAQVSTEAKKAAESRKMNAAAASNAAKEQAANLARMKRDQDGAARHAKIIATEQAKQAKGAADLAKANEAASDASGASWGNALSSLERMGPEGAIAAAGIKVFAGAVLLATAALIAMGIAITNVIAQRNQLLATFGALSGGGTGGAKTLAIVERLGVALPFATTKVAEWATGLQKAGFQGRALESAIKAVAAAEALLPGGGAAAESLLSTLALGGVNAMQLIATIKRGGPEARAHLAEMGLRVEDLAAALNMSTAQFKNAKLNAKQLAEAVEKALARKAAGPLADLMLTFPVLIGRVREGFLSLFSQMGPAVRPFMQAVKQLFDQFTKGGPAINFLKPIVAAVFSTLFSWATRAVGAISAIVTWMTKAGSKGGAFSSVIATIKGAWAALGKTFGLVMTMLSPAIGLFKAIFANALIMRGIGTVFSVIIAVITAVIVVFTLFAGVIASSVAFVFSLIGAVVGALAGFGQLIVDGVSNFDFSAFVAKMSGMAAAGLAAFKGIFGIASPSKVMLEQGEKNIGGAAATGVEKSADKFDESMEKLSPDGAKGGGKGKKSLAGTVINFYNCTFGDNSEEGIREAVYKVLAELNSEAPEPATT